MKAVFRGAPTVQPDPLRVEIHLPIAAPPVQTPRLVSAGALSPYERSADYASTQPRERMLWLEFDAPPENPDDDYFARVLSYAPDPMLTRGLPVTNPPEPPLPIDPEPIRVIRPGQSDDRAGLGAMQRLLPTVSPRHFLLPRPPGLSDDARELFGFFCYELRLGHVRGWSTVRARFGPPLRVTGVQHPAPTLACQAFRVQEAVQASALHATPVFEGRNLTPRVPATVIWLLLYAQVRPTALAGATSCSAADAAGSASSRSGATSWTSPRWSGGPRTRSSRCSPPWDCRWTARSASSRSNWPSASLRAAACVTPAASRAPGRGRASPPARPSSALTRLSG